MDYREMIQRIDQMQMSPRDRAAAKAQLEQAERWVDFTSSTAGAVRRWMHVFGDALRRHAESKGEGPLRRSRAA